MKPLSNKYRRNGYDYALVKRTDKAAMYQQKESGRHVAYEVGKIKRQKKDAVLPNGNIAEAGERFWSNEDFGVIAWTFYDLQRAEDKYAELS